MRATHAAHPHPAPCSMDREARKVVRPRPEIIRGYGGMSRKDRSEYSGRRNRWISRKSSTSARWTFPIPSITEGCRGAHFPSTPNIWTTSDPGDIYQDYFAYVAGLAPDAHIFATALDLPMNFFDTKLDRHISILRANYYPETVTSAVAVSCAAASTPTTPPLRSQGRNASWDCGRKSAALAEAFA